MKKQLVFLFLMILVVSPVVAKESVRITNGEWAPYLSEHLPHFGFASHIVQEAFKQVDVDVQFGFFPWKRAYKLALEGRWHGTVVWVYTEQRAKSFLYSDIVVTDAEYLFHLKSMPIRWKEIGDLRGKRIGGTLHTVYPVFEKAERQGILTIERTGTYENLFRRLLKKRIDAIPQVKEVGYYLIRSTLNKEQQSQITYSPTIIEKREYSLILSKARPENSRLLIKFNKGLKILHDSGVYQKLYNDFVNGRYDK